MTAAILLAASGPLLLRMGWQRLRAPVIAGWVALAGAAALLLASEGAWGLAAGATAAMASAGLMISLAGFTSPTGREAVRRESARRPREPLRWRGIGRCLLVFVAVVPAGLAASAFFAWAAQRAAFHAGWDAADSTALALFLAPLAWASAASWQLLYGQVTKMLMAPALLTGTGAFLWAMT